MTPTNPINPKAERALTVILLLLLAFLGRYLVANIVMPYWAKMRENAARIEMAQRSYIPSVANGSVSSEFYDIFYIDEKGKRWACRQMNHYCVEITK